MSDRIVEHHDDPIPRLRRLTMQVRVLIVIGTILVTAKLAYIALVAGWKVALASGGIVALLIGAWIWIESAIGVARMRRFMSKGRFVFPRKDGPPINGSVDSWLLLKDGFKAAAVDRNAGLIWFFPSRRTLRALKIGMLRRIEAGEGKNWLGRKIRTLRLSDSLHGAWVEFDVRDGNVDHFVRVIGETVPGAGIRTSQR